LSHSVVVLYIDNISQSDIMSHVETLVTSHVRRNVFMIRTFPTVYLRQIP